MNVILSETSASCLVKCPWQSPLERNVWYSRIQLSERSRKRQLGKSKRKGSHCVVQASIWSPSASSKGFSSKAFRREGISECVIDASRGSGRLIGISNAIDCTIYAEFTWVLVAISGKNNANGIALLRFEKDGIKMQKVFTSPESPLDGVVLRGPHVLFTTSDNVLVQGPNGKIACGGFDDGEVRTSERQFFLCGTEHDVEAVIAVKDTREGIPESMNVRTVHFSGTCGASRGVIDTKGSNAKATAVSLRRNIIAVADRDGSLRCFDISSGVLIWRSLPKKELENPICLSFYQDKLNAIAFGCETIWFVPSAISSDGKGSTRNPTVLFLEACTTTEGHKHGHFFAPWRESFLQLSDRNGAYCSDRELTTATTEIVPNQQKGAPFMRAVSRNLERRLDTGVERVTDAAQRQEEKIGILNHLRSLLTQIAGEKTRIAFPRQFHEALDNVVVLSRLRESHPRGYLHEDALLAEPNVPSTRVFMGGISKAVSSSRFVQLLDSKTGVDKSGRFVLIQVRLCVSKNVLAVDETESPALSLHLSIQFDRCIAAVWDVERKSGLYAGDTIWLRACAPISAIVANSVSSVESLRVIVRLDSDDGRSQHLGTFSLCAVLSSIVQSLSYVGRNVENGLLTFGRSIHVVAQGPSAHQLQRLLHRGEIGDNMEVTTYEKLACVRFNVSSNIELALAIARLRASVDDHVSLRSASELSKISLGNVDVSLRLIEEEMQAVRNIVAQRGSVGYDVNQIEEMLKLQVKVDESFGCLEEHFVGT